MGSCNAHKGKKEIVESFEPHMEDKFHSIENMEVEIEMNKEESKQKHCDGKCEDSDEKCEDCNKDDRTNMDKWRYTLITAVLFFIVVNPYTYKFVNFLLKRFFKIADKSGCPTFAGVVVHTIVFTLLLRGLMEFKL